MKKYLRFIFFILFSLAALSITSIIIITYSGYKIDLKYFRLVKTGSLYINTNPTRADIYINNEKLKTKTPAIINHLSPGRYNVKIEKKGYKTWEKNIEILEEITSFINYELVYEDIELNNVNEFSSDLFISPNSKYIAYIKIEKNLNSIYIYNVNTKDEFNIYSTEKNIKNIVWSENNKKIILNIDDSHFILDVNIISLPLIDKISSNNLVKLENFVENLEACYFNENNDYEILLRTKDNFIYKFNLRDLKISNKIVLEDMPNNNNIIFSNNSLTYINKNGSLIEYSFSDGVMSINNSYQGLYKISYKDGYIILQDKNQNFIIHKKSLRNEPIKIFGDKIKIQFRKILSFNDYEINVYDEKEDKVKFTSRYGQKIIDIDFYDSDYIVVVFEKDIKLVNIGDDINELSIISNIKTTEKIIILDKKINLIYKDNNKYMISSIDIK